MVDLPGYREWSAQFQGLERIITNLNDYNILVHPDEFSHPLDWIFEREFSGWLADYVDRGAPLKSLNDYKKG
jgi:hypothetical protein